MSLDGSAHAEINAECRMLEQLDSKYIIKYYAALNKKTDIWVRYPFRRCIAAHFHRWLRSSVRQAQRAT